MGNQSNMEIEWYSLTFVLILMNLDINKESKKMKNFFLQNFNFQGCI